MYSCVYLSISQVNRSQRSVFWTHLGESGRLTRHQGPLHWSCTVFHLLLRTGMEWGYHVIPMGMAFLWGYHVIEKYCMGIYPPINDREYHGIFRCTGVDRSHCSTWEEMGLVSPVRKVAGKVGSLHCFFKICLVWVPIMYSPVDRSVVNPVP